ncbi:hypothetical protein DICVIV_03475 [Dictyocaulus viviparus]|uniref:Uncharacterized protein n=1 Tax=Dictyocaulus viviparus TaxID=29172 RepID=A0A0D8Y128_DICVI|nr:hypothetical protein DICVIV_03475 [Dictyocaulus viviparus]
MIRSLLGAMIEHKLNSGMLFYLAVVHLLFLMDRVFAMSCFLYARNELLLDEIIDHGLITCPQGSVGCFYYPHRQCIGKRFGILYSITGCLDNNEMCPADTMSIRKINGTTRCCFEYACNLSVYKFLHALPRSIPQHDFNKCNPCPQCV